MKSTTKMLTVLSTMALLGSSHGVFADDAQAQEHRLDGVWRMCLWFPVVLNHAGRLSPNDVKKSAVMLPEKAKNSGNIVCAKYRPMLIQCPYRRVAPANATISWTFCPRNRLCRKPAPRSFFGFLNISSLSDEDQGSHHCIAARGNNVTHERWEFRKTFSWWELIWTDSRGGSETIVLSNEGEMMFFGDAWTSTLGGIRTLP